MLQAIPLNPREYESVRAAGPIGVFLLMCKYEQLLPTFVCQSCQSCSNVLHIAHCTMHIYLCAIPCLAMHISMRGIVSLFCTPPASLQIGVEEGMRCELWGGLSPEQPPLPICVRCSRGLSCPWGGGTHLKGVGFGT